MRRATKLFALVILCICSTSQIQSQSLQLALENLTASTGDTITLTLTSNNFENIVSLQHSINWDVNVMTYLSHEDIDLNDVAIGDFEIAEGILRVSWFDINGLGISISEIASIVSFRFLVTGNPGDYTDVALTGTPLEIQIFQGDGDINDSITLDPSDGSVSIVDVVSLSSANVSSVTCNGNANGSITLNFSGTIDSLAWNGPDNFFSNEEDIFNLNSGDYNLSVFDVNGILLLDSTFIILEPLAALEIDNIQTESSDCEQATGSASIIALGGTEPYTYNIGNGASTNNSFSNLSPGEYFVSIIDANDCETQSSFYISTTALASFNIGGDQEFCKGEEAFLDAGNFENYLWSTGETSSNINITESGNYSVTITNAFNCVAADTVNVTFFLEPAAVLEVDSIAICPGDSTELNVFGATDYLWIDVDSTLSDPQSQTPIAFPSETTTYMVIASNICGEDSAEVKVEIFEVTATAGKDTCIAPAREVRLDASGGETYDWFRGNYELSNYSIPNPRTSPEISTDYFITIVDEYECVTTDTVTVLVAEDPRDVIKAVNLITPNGDGKNDVLEFDNIKKYDGNVLKIFNRWGDLIYQRVNYQTDEDRFDGTKNGKRLPPGVYYYTLSFQVSEIKQTLMIVYE